MANLLWADSPGYYGTWGGSINQLPNGNIEFDANSLLLPPSPNIASEVQENYPNGVSGNNLEWILGYRCLRIGLIEFRVFIPG